MADICDGKIAQGPRTPDEWFTVRMLPDDVTLKFDDGKELFVSKSFLMYASSVFKDMFENITEERRTDIVTLNGKQYDHFLELLMCLHPGVAKPITSENVMHLFGLALEYQMTALLERCRNVFRIWMSRGNATENMLGGLTLDQMKNMILRYKEKELIQCTNVILNVLSGVSTSDKTLFNEAITLLSCIDSQYYDDAIMVLIPGD